VVFDDRYAGKPLVYCGTGSIMPSQYNGEPTWLKIIHPGDRILMAGGRVGKDGIHGATFSSVEIDKHSPKSAVQIGSPITQKLLADFLEQATETGLVHCSTDNGAGGLSSSVGELATISGGAVVHLDRVPLKYSGLKPWEIFVSESQERMTLVVSPEHVDEVMELALAREVEISDVGEFTDSGYLTVLYAGSLVAHLDLETLHEGVPRKTMEAVWSPPDLAEPDLTDLTALRPSDPNRRLHEDVLMRLLASDNICSRERVIRQYDHEVKGKTVVKPLMGPGGTTPQDAAVMRFDHQSYAGIAISNGILPRYGDIDAYEMSAGAFDEAVRQIISVGGKLPDLNASGPQFWSVNDNFCVPDSAYEPTTNPDGRYKLAQLVRMCDALYDMSTTFLIPMTSGKDSMKNDFRADGVKISVPPTILYSMVARLEDVRKVTTSDFKASGDVIYLLGETYDELGASELYRLLGTVGRNVPRVRKEKAMDLYRRMGTLHDQGMLQSSHDLSDGGLAVSLAESTFGTGFGADVRLPNSPLGPLVLLYSESHSRFLVTLKAEDEPQFLAVVGNRGVRLGCVTKAPRLEVRANDELLMDLPVETLLHCWKNGLEK